MIRPLTWAVALAMIAALTPAGSVAAADPPSYDDPGMHFSAPIDFEKIDLPGPVDPLGSADSDDPTPVALFAYHKGKIDQKVITIVVARFDGTVDQFDSSHVSDERKNDDTFVQTNQKTALANGMPAYYLKINSGATAGRFVQRVAYLVCDRTRSIVVQYSGPSGFDENMAKAALSTLSVVVYPRRRP